MPKLAKKVAERVEKAETQDYTVFPGGIYVLKLLSCSAEKDGQPRIGPKGPYWTWAFEIVSTSGGAEEVEAPNISPDGKLLSSPSGKTMKVKGRKIWTNTSLAPDADWKMKEVFLALGYTIDTDTDEMIGDLVLGKITLGPDNRNNGELSNSLGQLMPYDGGAEAADPGEWEDPNAADEPDEEAAD